MKILIVEDETAASENLIAILQEIDSSIEILHVLESVQQTVRWLGSNPAPDLIFMDIHLSDGSAFTLFDMMDVHTPIIFTTAYDRYALAAFAVNSIDYLLKPIKTSDVIRSLDKFKRLTKTDVISYLQNMVALKTSRQEEEYNTSILVPTRDKLVPVSLDDVVCFYSKDRNTQVYLKDSRVFQFNRTLDSIINSVDPSRFFRANKQYIVAKDSVKEIVIWFDSRLRLNMQIELPEPLFVSKNKAAEFKIWMTK